MKSLELPEEITISLSDNGDCDCEDLFEEICDYMSDYISDKTGFCHKGFEIEIQIKAKNIQYDTEE